MTVERTETATRRGLSLAGTCLTLGDGEDSVTALDHVDLRVEPGEFVAVVGPSGSGKSSLLAVAGGLTDPDSGSVTVADTVLGDLRRRALTRFRLAHIGFVFQAGNLLPSLTAVDQLRLITRISGAPATADPMALLDAVGMAQKAGRRPHQLSGGERQRVGIARALMADPELLLVDEPTAALDRARSHEVVELLADRAHRGQVATVMVTHDHEMLGHCDRVVEMTDGRLVAHRS